MIVVTLFIFLMILSVLAKVISVLLGIPHFTEITNMMNSMALMIITVKYTGLLISFIYQQYERSRNERRKYVRS